MLPDSQPVPIIWLKALPSPSTSAQTGDSAQYRTPIDVAPAALASFIIPYVATTEDVPEGKKSGLTRKVFSGARPPTTGICFSSTYCWTAWSATLVSPTIATTFSCSTSSLADWRAFAGSPASSLITSLTGCPLRPPASLIILTQAEMPSLDLPSAAACTPEQLQIVPMTIGSPARVVCADGLAAESSPQAVSPRADTARQAATAVHFLMLMSLLLRGPRDPQLPPSWRRAAARPNFLKLGVAKIGAATERCQ